MPQVRTNVPHFEKSLGVWRKLYLYSGGRLEALAGLGRDDLASLGLSPDLWVVVDAVRTWMRPRRIPFPVVMVLWRLRDSQESSGGWRRIPESSAAETGCVYRYIELAVMAGEGLDTDRHIALALKWLAGNQLGNGGFPTHEGETGGETGTTARVVRVLVSLLRHSAGDEEMRRKAEEITAGALKFLIQGAEAMDDMVYWKRYREDTAPAVGATALAVQALIAAIEAGPRLPHGHRGPAEQLVVKAVKWLLSTQNSDGGWGEEPGRRSSVSVTYNAARALYMAMDKGLVPGELGSRVREGLRRAAEWLLTQKPCRPGDLYLQAYIARSLVLVIRMSSIIGVDTCGAGKALSTALRCLMKLYIKTYDPSFDKYHSEIAAIALLEASQLLNEGGECIDYKQEQLYRMTPLPPRFLLEKILRNSGNPSEILYLFTTRRLLGVTDKLVRLDIVSAVIGTAVGLALAMDVLSDNIPRYIAGLSSAPALLAAASIMLLINILWLWIKLMPSNYAAKLLDYTFSLAAATWYTVSLLGIEGAAVFPTVMFYTFIIDIAGWFTDRTVLAKAIER